MDQVLYVEFSNVELWQPGKFESIFKASGLRSCRYALECAGVKEIIANDLSVLAVDEIKKNAQFNGVDHLIKPNKDDAIDLMARHRTKETNVEVIDLDPYGSGLRVEIFRKKKIIIFLTFYFFENIYFLILKEKTPNPAKPAHF